MIRTLITTAVVAALLVTACRDDEPTTTDAPVTAVDGTDTADAANGVDARFASLASRPWADPDDAHETPEAAVADFLDFAAGAAAGGILETGGADVGAYRAVDARSGEVPVHLVETVVDETDLTEVRLVITVAVTRAGPQDTWWVASATTDGLTVDAPAIDAVVGSAFELDVLNEVIVGRVEVRLFGAGAGAPFYVATANQGWMGTGRRTGVVDTTSCGEVSAPETAGPDFFPVTCDGPGTLGEDGTLVVVTTSGITTVPVVLGESLASCGAGDCDGR